MCWDDCILRGQPPKKHMECAFPESCAHRRHLVKLGETQAWIQRGHGWLCHASVPQPVVLSPSRSYGRTHDRGGVWSGSSLMHGRSLNLPPPLAAPGPPLPCGPPAAAPVPAEHWTCWGHGPSDSPSHLSCEPKSDGLGSNPCVSPGQVATVAKLPNDPVPQFPRLKRGLLGANELLRVTPLALG